MPTSDDSIINFERIKRILLESGRLSDFRALRTLAEEEEMYIVPDVQVININDDEDRRDVPAFAMFDQVQRNTDDIIDLQRRVANIETNHSKAALPDRELIEIVTLVNRLFSKLDYVKEIYCKYSGDQYHLTFLYDDADEIKAQDEIVRLTNDLEASYPDSFFEYYIRNRNDTDYHGLSDWIQVFSREE